MFGRIKQWFDRKVAEAETAARWKAEATERQRRYDEEQLFRDLAREEAQRARDDFEADLIGGDELDRQLADARAIYEPRARRAKPTKTSFVKADRIYRPTQTSGTKARFVYVALSGEVSIRDIRNWNMDQETIEGFCMDAKAGRTFRLDRIGQWLEWRGHGGGFGGPGITKDAD